MATLLVARWVLAGLSPDSDRFILDESLLPPVVTPAGVVLARAAIVPFLVGVVGVLILRRRVAGLSRLLFVIVLLVVLVPIIVEGIDLLFTSEKAYRDALWRMHAQTGDDDFITLDGMLDETLSFRARALPRFLGFNVLLLPVTSVATLIGAMLAVRGTRSRPIAPRV